MRQIITSKAHQLVTFSAHNEVVPLEIAQAARDEHEDMTRALQSFVDQWEKLRGFPNLINPFSGPIVLAKAALQKVSK